MDKKDKGQTQTIQWTEKTKDKQRRYNVQKRQTTNTGHTMYEKDKRKTQAIQYKKNTKEKHRSYNVQKW
jgi:poly(3-hydroxybutyrate) depolymerase